MEKTLRNPIIKAMNDTYTPEYCEALSLAYGSGMMAEGGSAEIDLLLTGVDCAHKKILDFGSGLGGMAIHIAKKHNASVVGVDINPGLITQAINNIPSALASQVSFVLIDDQTLHFASESFDMIMSKGSICHLTPQQRKHMFKEFYRILKKDAQLVISDLLSSTTGAWSSEFQELMASEGLIMHACSLEDYIKTIEESGFKNIVFESRSNAYIGYNHAIINRLHSESIKETFIRKFGENTWKEHVQGYQNIARAYENGSVLTVKFTGQK